MEIKQWLWRYRDAERMLEKLKVELDIARANSNGVRAIQYSDMPKSHSCTGDLSDAIVIYEQIIDKIATYEKRRAKVMAEIMEAIETVEDANEQLVLSLRYISLLEWSEIAARMNYSERRVFQIHGAALQTLRHCSKLH